MCIPQDSINIKGSFCSSQLTCQREWGAGGRARPQSCPNFTSSRNEVVTLIMG